MAWVNPWLMVFRHLSWVPLYSVVVNIMNYNFPPFPSHRWSWDSTGIFQLFHYQTPVSIFFKFLYLVIFVCFYHYFKIYQKMMIKINSTYHNVTYKKFFIRSYDHIYGVTSMWVGPMTCFKSYKSIRSLNF